MGCHTWFYKRIEYPSHDEMKNLLLDVLNFKVETFTNYINDPLCLEYIELLEYDDSYTLENLQYMISVSKRTIRIIEKDLCKEAVKNKYLDFTDKILIEHNNNLYQNISEYHDTFRKYGYPEIYITSLEETLSYINDPSNECVIYEKSIERLKEYWEKYPDGLIEFG